MPVSCFIAITQRPQAQELMLLTHSADLKDSVDAMAVMEPIENESGPLEVLVTCAGAARRTPPDELDAAALQTAPQLKYFS